MCTLMPDYDCQWRDTIPCRRGIVETVEADRPTWMQKTVTTPSSTHCAWNLAIVALHKRAVCSSDTKIWPARTLPSVGKLSFSRPTRKTIWNIRTLHDRSRSLIHKSPQRRHCSISHLPLCSLPLDDIHVVFNLSFKDAVSIVLRRGAS
ncbi:hypothetical protein BDZ89DRAFT_359740 [Hymenopellis radicata]|nr:hypothetical protein BDZ89DRAFT_359740 [Hymenopellis radicata]